MLLNALQTIVATTTSLSPQAHRPKRESQIIAHHSERACGPSIIVHQRPDRSATLIHVGGRHQQTELLALNRPAGTEPLKALFFLERQPLLVCQGSRHQLSKIVARPLVTLAGI